jgi:3'5'-cyclic nucleotide phosphodiesterase
VSNQRLAVEDPEVADKYFHKSIAEQRSVDTAFELLFLPRFGNLRACIYKTEKEYTRFRQLVVNSVLATDIFDKELKSLRESRWNLAFSKAPPTCNKNHHRKATIVIEHIIQASDVAHTM